jgi:hypothetical protein
MSPFFKGGFKGSSLFKDKLLADCRETLCWERFKALRFDVFHDDFVWHIAGTGYKGSPCPSVMIPIFTTGSFELHHHLTGHPSPEFILPLWPVSGFLPFSGKEQNVTPVEES